MARPLRASLLDVIVRNFIVERASVPMGIQQPATNDGEADISRPPSREWPRCEPGYTHYELGAMADSSPTAVMAKRYTPRYGVRKD
jgi:hypothetical protein